MLSGQRLHVHGAEFQTKSALRVHGNNTQATCQPSVAKGVWYGGRSDQAGSAHNDACIAAHLPQARHRGRRAVWSRRHWPAANIRKDTLRRKLSYQKQSLLLCTHHRRMSSDTLLDGEMHARTLVHGATAPAAGAVPVMPPDAASLLPPVPQPCTCGAHPEVMTPAEPETPARSFVTAPACCKAVRERSPVALVGRRAQRLQVVPAAVAPQHHRVQCRHACRAGAFAHARAVSATSIVHCRALCNSSC